MSDPIVVNLSRLITSVKVLDDYPASVDGEQVDSPKDPSPDLEAQKAMFTQVCQTLNSAAVKLNEFYDKVLVEHTEEIAKLSVEIARKILAQKVENGDYEIESIIKEALKNAPSRHDVVVHLNPEDHARCWKGLQQEQDEKEGVFAGVKFVSNPNIYEFHPEPTNLFRLGISLS